MRSFFCVSHEELEEELELLLVLLELRLDVCLEDDEELISVVLDYWRSLLLEWLVVDEEEVREGVW